MAEAEQKKKAGGGGLMKTLAIVVFVAALSAGGAWYYFQHVAATEEAEGGEKEVVKKADAVYWQFEPAFVVNLPDGAYMRYVKLDIALMMHDVELPPLLEKHLPVLRNAILMLVSSASYEDLLSLEGKEGLRDAILAALNAQLVELGVIAEPAAGIQALYFTNFVMQ